MSLPGRLAVVLLALAAALVLAAPAIAVVAPSELRQNDVAIESGASVSDDDRGELEASAAALAEAGRPTKYVVLAERPADPTAYARSVREAVGSEWAVFVLSPGNLRIDSPAPTSAEQAAFASEVNTLRDDPIEGTIAVAERLAEESGASVEGGSSDDGGNGGGVAGFAIIGGLIVVGGGGAILWSRRAKKRRLEQTAAANRAELDPMVDGLAAQISDLDGDMEMGGERAVAAKGDYEAATMAYGEAREILALPSPTPAQVEPGGRPPREGPAGRAPGPRGARRPPRRGGRRGAAAGGALHLQPAAREGRDQRQRRRARRRAGRDPHLPGLRRPDEARAASRTTARSRPPAAPCPTGRRRAWAAAGGSAAR